jgi:squalene synthase HpnC
MKFDLEDSYNYCREITLSHYENFPVASWLLPASIRKHIFAVYAFARIADDIADEGDDSKQEKIEQLKIYKNHFLEYSNSDSYPHFTALWETANKYNIPNVLFTDLIDAFIQDNEKSAYENFDELLNYCKKSANPVGRIILHLFNYESEKMFELSDNVCTALQLTNFWQDISFDIKKGRCYIPQADLKKFRVSFETIRFQKFNEDVKELIKFQVERTHNIFQVGEELLDHLKGLLKLEIKLTILGGKSILKKIEKMNYNTLVTRPKLSFFNKTFLLFHLVLP